MGVVSNPNIFSPNTTISSSQVNGSFSTLYNEFNGNISAANLATGAVTTSKIADSNVTSAKLADGAVTSTKVAGIDKSVTTTDSNPYKFSAYRSASNNVGNATFGLIGYDTELFDTNSNFDVSTHPGRYTAPVSGFYFFTANFRCNAVTDGSQVIIAIYKNGSEIERGDQNQSSSGSGTVGVSISRLVQLAATDYVEIFGFGTANYGISVGSGTNHFDGFLVSRT